MGYEPSDGDLPTDDFLGDTHEYTHGETLSPDEYESLKTLNTELVNANRNQTSVLILGSYDRDKKPRLLYIKDSLAQSPTCNPYLMEDFADLNAVVKFQLVADQSDYIVGIVEDDQGGFQLEMGMTIVLARYFNRCTVLKRTYPEKGDRNVYNWMLQNGVFDLFDMHGRLREWGDDTPFETAAGNVVDDLIK